MVSPRVKTFLKEEKCGYSQASLEEHTGNWDQGGLWGRKLRDQERKGDPWLCLNPFLSLWFEF